MSSNNTTSTPLEDKVLLNLELGAYAFAIAIVILFSYLERNSNGRRPGIPIPVDLLCDDKLIYAYAAAFGCSSSAILVLLITHKETLLSLDIPDEIRPWVQVPVWMFIAIVVSFKFYPIFAAIRHETPGIGPLIVPVWMFIAIVVSFKFYPIFAAIRHVTPGIGPLIGFVYCCYLSGEHIYVIVLSQQGDVLQDVGTIMTELPILVCFAILLFYFIHSGVKDIRIMIERSKVTIKDEIIHNIHLNRYERLYVKWILKKDNKRLADTENSVYSILESYKTEVKNTFNMDTPLKTSPRVIVTFIVCGIIILQVGVFSVYNYYPLRNAFVSLSDSLVNATHIQQFETFVHVMDVSSYVSISISTPTMFLYVVLIYRNYKKDLRKMYSGDFSFLPMKVREQENKEFVAASLRYAGTQIAYMFWCYIILLTSIFVLCFLLAYFLILPLLGKVPEEFLIPVKAAAPIFIGKYLFQLFQTAIVNRYFLQDHVVDKPDSTKGQKALALRNRKLFSVVNYFMFFFNVIIGFFGCISRILLGALIGILTVARIDRSLLPSGYEHLDSGYKAYVGLIMLELYHRNPILLVFCDEMLTFQHNEPSMIELETPNQNTGYQRSISDSLGRLKRTRIRNKWLKAFTVVNNPCLRNMTKGKNKRGFSESNCNTLNNISEA